MNKGEDSELITTTGLLSDKFTFRSKIEYILSTNSVKYKVNHENIDIFKDDKYIKSISKEVLKQSCEELIILIKKGSKEDRCKKSNEIRNNILFDLSPNLSKADLYVKFVGDKKIYGCSIKSHLGALPTLINPTKAIFRIDNYKGKEKSAGKPTATVLKLIDNGCTLKFVKFKNDTFQKNMKAVSKDVEKIMGELISKHYGYNGQDKKTISNLLKDDKEAIPIIKKLLVTMATGMMPNTLWDKENSVVSIFLILEKDSSLSILDNQSSFGEYFIQNTRLDTPSTTRHGGGKIFIEDDGKYYIDLNLQVKCIPSAPKRV